MLLDHGCTCTMFIVAEDVTGFSIDNIQMTHKMRLTH